MFIRIRGDNGFEECPSCLNCETELCESCEDGEMYEPNQEDEKWTENTRRLAA